MTCAFAYHVALRCTWYILRANTLSTYICTTVCVLVLRCSGEHICVKHQPETTGWFEVVRYDDKRWITITNLVETMWLSKYPRQIEIYVHDFIKYLIEDEYGITAKPSTSVNPVSNAVLGRIHQVIGNLVRTFNVQRTYIDKK